MTAGPVTSGGVPAGRGPARIGDRMSGPVPSGPTPARPVRPAPTMVDLRLAPSAVCAWVAALLTTGGIITGSTARVASLTGLLVAMSLGAWWWAYSVRHPRGGAHALTPAGSLRLAGALCVVSGACALVTGSAAWDAHARDPTVRTVAVGATSVRVVAELLTDPAPRSGTWATGHTVDVRVLRVAPADSPPTGAASPSSVRMLAQGRGWGALARGDVVEVRGRVDTTFRADPPWAGTLRADDPRLLERPGGWKGLVREVRSALQVATLGLSSQARALVPGMAVGDDRLLDADLGDAMVASSLTHLTAVSGAHVALMLATIVWVVPGRGWLRAGGAVVTMAALVAVVGPEPSVVRSVATAGVSVVGLLSRRPGQAHSALLAVVTGVLLVDPWSARSFGFALSVLATWGVIGPAADWVRHSRVVLREDTRAGRAARRLVAVVAIPVAAQLTVAPVMVLLNPWLPTWGVVANVVAAPAVAPASLLGLGAACVAPWWSQGGHWLAAGAGVFTGWIAGVGTLLGSWPLARAPWPGGSGGAVALAAVEVLGVLAWRMRWWLRDAARAGHGRACGADAADAERAWETGAAVPGVPWHDRLQRTGPEEDQDGQTRGANAGDPRGTCSGRPRQGIRGASR